MSKSSAAANVIDLQAFRQKKAMREEQTETRPMMTTPVLVPVWFCWIPMWAPVIA